MTGAQLRTFKGHTNNASSVSFSPDGARIASASFDGTIKLWDASTDVQPRTLTGHTDKVTSVSFKPDGMWIASASLDKTIKLWDVSTGEQLYTLNGHAHYVTSVCFSPDGARIASASYDGTIKLWDAPKDGEPQTLTGHTGVVTSVCFSPDGARIASASRDSTIQLWDASTGEQLKKITGHTHGVTSVCFSPDGTRIASASLDKTIKLWDASTGEQLSRLTGHTGVVTSVCFSPDGTRIASASLDKTIKLWDASTGEPLDTLKGHAHYVTSVCFSPDGSRIASASRDHTIRLWDASTGEEIRTFKGRTASESSVRFSPDGSRIASANWDHTIKLWDASSGEQLRMFKGHTANVTRASFSPDGERIYSEAEGERLVWDAESGQRIENADWNSSVLTQDQSPDGRWLAVPSGDRILVVNLEFKNKPAEKAYRAFKAKPNRFWHQQQTAEALQNQDWFAADFHARWWLKLAPESLPAFDAVQWVTTNKLSGAADSLAAEGKWSDAAGAYQVHREATALNPTILCRRAMTQLAADDQEAYRATCEELIELCGKKPFRKNVFWVLLTCCYGEDALEDYRPLVSLAEQYSEDLKPFDFRRVSLGAVLLRAGYLERAKEVLRPAYMSHGVLYRATDQDDPLRISHAVCGLFLAKAQQEIGEPEAAQKLLNSVRALVEKIESAGTLTGSSMIGGVSLPSWANRFFAEYLKRELVCHPR